MSERRGGGIEVPALIFGDIDDNPHSCCNFTFRKKWDIFEIGDSERP